MKISFISLFGTIHYFQSPVVKNYGIFDKTGTNRGNLLIELIIKYPQRINEKSKLLIKSLS